MLTIGLLWVLSRVLLNPSFTEARVPASQPSGAPPDYPIDAKLEGPTSPFTDVVIELTKSWPKGREFCRYETQPLQIQMVKIPTADRNYYVGFKKCMEIRAPLSAVARVIEDVEHYEQLFPGDKRVRILAKDRNKTTLAWERVIPVFFVPNEKYQLDYLSAAVGPGVKMYRTQLKQGDRLRFSDALVVIEAKGPNLTLYSDYEFYEADYGIGLFGINAVGSKEIWKESLRGSYLSLLSIRFKSENQDWDYKRIEKASEAALQGVDVDNSAVAGSLSD